MSMLTTEVLEAIADISGINKIGILGENDKVSLIPAGGGTVTKYRDGSQKNRLAVSLQAKGKSQKSIIASIDSKINTLIKVRRYQFDGGVILGISLASSPLPAAVLDSGEFIYTAGINIDYISKGD